MNALSAEEIAARLVQRPGWTVAGSMMRRSFTFASFGAAIGFVNAVALCAEKADHHPDLYLHDYKHVDVTLSTHSAGGITEHDFNLAAAIDALIA